jgi:hypothetical protein
MSEMIKAYEDKYGVKFEDAPPHVKIMWQDAWQAALQSGEPIIEVENGQVVMSRIGANFTGYLYATPQAVVTDELTGKQWSAMRTVIQEHAEKFRSADTYEMASAYMDAAPEAVYQALLSAGKGGE